MAADIPSDSLDHDEQELVRFLGEWRTSVSAAPPAKRRGVSKRERVRIGNRDGWICCLCGEPVDKDIPWRPAPKVPEHVLTQATVILVQGVDERVTAWVGEDTDRARAVLAEWHRTPLHEEYQRASTVLFELRRQLGPYTGTTSDVRLRFQIADAQAAQDTARERAFGKEVAGEPSIKDAVRAVEATYVRRNALYPTVEHIVPVIAGGGDDDANLAIAHHGCNVSWSDRGKDAAVENRTETFLAWRKERRHSREQHWDEARMEAVAVSRAAERKRRADLVALWIEDDQLRRELRRMGDRLRAVSAEKERAKIQNLRGSIKAKRERIQRKINRLEVGDRIVIGIPGLPWP